jgi:predicted Zn-dependent protease
VIVKGALVVGDAKLLEALTTLVKRTRADGMSVCAHAKVRRVFRFAQQAIHQDLIQESVTVTVKLIQDDRVGVAGTDTLEPKSLSRCARAAEEIARHSPTSPRLPPLAPDHRVHTTNDYVPATSQTSSEACVGSLQRLFHLSRGTLKTRISKTSTLPLTNHS